MFYSRLRWKIKDLEEENSDLLWKNDALQKRCFIAEDDFRHLLKKNSALQHELEITQMAKDELSCDLVMTEEQLTSANEEIKRLEGQVRAFSKHYHQSRDENELLRKELDMAGQQFEAANEEIGRLQEKNDHLRDLLCKKGCCPCDKRRKH